MLLSSGRKFAWNGITGVKYGGYTNSLVAFSTITTAASPKRQKATIHLHLGRRVDSSSVIGGKKSTVGANTELTLKYVLPKELVQQKTSDPSMNKLHVQLFDSISKRMLLSFPKPLPMPVIKESEDPAEEGSLLVHAAIPVRSPKKNGAYNYKIVDKGERDGRNVPMVLAESKNFYVTEGLPSLEDRMLLRTARHDVNKANDV